MKTKDESCTILSFEQKGEDVYAIVNRELMSVRDEEGMLIMARVIADGMGVYTELRNVILKAAEMYSKRPTIDISSMIHPNSKKS